MDGNRIISLYISFFHTPREEKGDSIVHKVQASPQGWVRGSWKLTTKLYIEACVYYISSLWPKIFFSPQSIRRWSFFLPTSWHSLAHRKIAHRHRVYKIIQLHQNHRHSNPKRPVGCCICIITTTICYRIVVIIFFMSIFYAYKQAILATYSMYYVCFGAHKKMSLFRKIELDPLSIDRCLLSSMIARVRRWHYTRIFYTVHWM